MPAGLDKDSGEKEKNLLWVTPAENPFTSSDDSMGLYLYSHTTNLYHAAGQKGKEGASLSTLCNNIEHCCTSVSH